MQAFTARVAVAGVTEKGLQETDEYVTCVAHLSRRFLFCLLLCFQLKLGRSVAHVSHKDGLS